MSTKYRTGNKYLDQQPLIRPVEVERETETSIWVNGHREAKESDWQVVFDTWEQAHDYLVARAHSKVLGARRQLELANSFLGNVKGMKNPQEQS